MQKWFKRIHTILAAAIGIGVWVQMFLAGVWHAEIVSTPEAHVFFGLGLLAASLLAFGNIATAADDMPAQAVQTVNINEADARSMAKTLKGVGLRRAEAIVAWREKNGRFFSAEELSQVRGIGRSTVQKNADRIVVK